MTLDQLSLFQSNQSLPDGFLYRPEFMSEEEQRVLVHEIAELPFAEFRFQGYLGKRRVVSFGWHYDFDTRELTEAKHMPGFLLALRERAAAFADLQPTDLQHALVTEYSAGAGIGWHKDKGVFREVIGVSLLSASRFRLRRKAGAGWERASILAEPRSAYLLRGPARTEWEHSIPPVDSLRYSITFRNIRTE